MNYKKIRVTGVTPISRHSKLFNFPDIDKLLEFFTRTSATTLEAMAGTGILRNSITYYVRHLERNGSIVVIGKRLDRLTGRPAKVYTAAPAIMKAKSDQLSLW